MLFLPIYFQTSFTQVCSYCSSDWSDKVIHAFWRRIKIYVPNKIQSSSPIKKLFLAAQFLLYTFFPSNPFPKAISPFELNRAVGPLEIFPPKSQIFAQTNFSGREQLPQSPKALEQECKYYIYICLRDWTGKLEGMCVCCLHCHCCCCFRDCCSLCICCLRCCIFVVVVVWSGLDHSEEKKCFNLVSYFIILKHSMYWCRLQFPQFYGGQKSHPRVKSAATKWHMGDL